MCIWLAPATVPRIMCDICLLYASLAAVWACLAAMSVQVFIHETSYRSCPRVAMFLRDVTASANPLPALYESQ
jgi:hypothetical protein